MINTHNTFAQKPHKEYYENGKLKAVGYYDEKGKETGEWKIYHPNGTLHKKGNYHKGKASGEWKIYYDNEELLRRLHPAVREYLDIIVEKEKPLAVYLEGEDTDELEQNCGEYSHGVELTIVEGKGAPQLLDERIRIEKKNNFFF